MLAGQAVTAGSRRVTAEQVVQQRLAGAYLIVVLHDVMSTEIAVTLELCRTQRGMRALP